MRKNNLCLQLASRETDHRGGRLRSMSALPQPIIKRLDKEFGRIPSLVTELRSAMDGKIVLRDTLKKVAEALVEPSDRTQLDGKERLGREWFVLFGGADALARLVQVPSNPSQALLAGFHGDLGPRVSSALDLKVQGLQLLRDLCYSLQSLSEQLSSQKSFVVHLFQLMREHKTFEEAVGLCEEVLAFRGEVFSLSNIPDIEGLIKSLSKRQLALFCGVLALVVFEAEDRSSSETLKVTPSADLLMARREQVMLTHVKTTDRNHAVLLGIKELLPRLAQLVVQRMPISRKLEDLAALPDGQFHELLALMGLEDTTDWAVHLGLAPVGAGGGGAGGAGAGGHGGAGGVGEGGAHEGLKVLAALNHQVEVLFVMCTLLAGKRKSEVQTLMIADLGIIPALLNMFEALDWSRPPATSPPLERIHGPGCECNPESALRIQYLRLIHNLCDMDSDVYSLKHRLLSVPELKSVSSFAALDDLKHASLAEHGSAAAAGGRGGRGGWKSASMDGAGSGMQEEWVGTLSSPLAHQKQQQQQQRMPESSIEFGRGHGEELDGQAGAPSNHDDSWEHYNLADHSPGPSNTTARSLASPGLTSPMEFHSSFDSPTSHRPGEPQTVVAGAAAALTWEGIGGGGFAAAAGAVPARVLGTRGSCLSTRRTRASAAQAKTGEGAAIVEKGLITRILQVFMRETPDSTYRFWLASCVEAYIRGSDSQSQVLFARSGLLRHLVEGVLNSQCSGNLQTNFDLLGELVKWNPEVFAIFNEVLDDKTYSRFMQVVVSNLVDSNVFLRSVVLSLEYFASRQSRILALGCSYDLSTCKLRAFLRHNTLRLLRDLMTVISVDEVNQENVCCLNTALSICIFAKDHNLLDSYISSIRWWEVSRSRPGKVTANFQALVRFWQRYYLFRGKDGFSLEISSNIPYSRWRDIVQDMAQRLKPESLAVVDQLNARESADVS